MRTRDPQMGEELSRHLEYGVEVDRLSIYRFK
jgi:hypothetical protein